MEQKLVYQVEELIPILKLSRPSLYKALRNGDLPSIRVGRRVLIPTKALETYLANAGQPQPKQS